jgi:hypothetical protein
MKRRCRMCKGLGYLDDPHCELCKRRIPADNEWWTAKEDEMPCGHLAGLHLKEFVVCLECWGRGKSFQWITLEDWRVYRRHWGKKLAWVTFGMFVLLVFPLVIVWGTPLNEEVCGSWWYFFIPLWLLFKLH